MVGKKLLWLTALVGSLSFAAETGTQAVKETPQAVNSAKVANQQSALSEAVGQLKQAELAKVVKEAAEVFQETNKALLLLQKGQTEEALVILNRVAAKLDKLVSEYGLVKLPIDVRFVEFNGITDLKLAWEYNKQVKKLVAKNDFVNARAILAVLRDEIDIITTYMSLGLYRDAIKLAIKLLNEGKIDSAVLAVQSALGTLEVETVIVPKPIIEAQILLERAEKLYKVNPEGAKALIERIKKDLELTVALGYVRSMDELKPLMEKLNELEKAIESNAVNTEQKLEEAKQKLREVRQEATKQR
jgi:tetratricopeptide (TPR) repeat protein